MTSLDEVLEQQIAYYRVRAAEYDQWFYRTGRYDRGAAHTQQWQAEAAQVRQALYDSQLQGRILDVAAGTGIWTQELAKMSDSVVAVDSSPEVLEINRYRVGDERVQYLQVDLFAWQPETAFDAIFMGFWLSHVPLQKLAGFLQKLSQWLVPGGRLFMVDSVGTPHSTSTDLTTQLNDTLTQRAQNPIQADAELHQEMVLRRLNDGSEFYIIKHFHEPEFLQHQFEPHGLAMTLQTTENFFIYGSGQKNYDLKAPVGAFILPSLAR